MKMMKISLVKHMWWSVVSCTMSSRMKAKLMLMGLLKSKRLLFSDISHKMNSLFHSKRHKFDLYNNGGGSGSSSNNNNHSNYDLALTIYKAAVHDTVATTMEEGEEEEEFALGCLFGDDYEYGRELVSVLQGRCSDAVEEEIDSLADEFINKFHTNFMLQRQHSYRRYQDMLARGA